MEGFVRILDLIKAQFKTILLISHLDSLKDVVDQQILIEKILTDDSEKEQQGRIAFAQSHTWENNVNEIGKAILQLK